MRTVRRSRGSAERGRAQVLAPSTPQWRSGAISCIAHQLLKDFMPHFTEIWFDLDGTLAVAGEVWNAAHDELRYQVYADTQGIPVTPAVKEAYLALYAKHKSNSAVFTYLGFPSDYWMNRFSELDLVRHYQPRDDVKETIQVLAGRATLGIFTNNKHANIERTLTRLQIPRNLFSKMLSADEASERKPHPHGFEIMLQMADCEPSNLLYVGDRYDVDIAPVQKLGAKGALVWAEDPRADYSFPDFTGLLEINA